MNISMQLAVVAAVCLCLAEGAPDIRVARAKQQRPTRGFKNVEMMTARGFGKRDPSNARAERIPAPFKRAAYHPTCLINGEETYGPCDYMGARGMGKRNDYINDDQGTPAHKRPTFRPKCWSEAPAPDGKGKYDICQLMTAYGMGKKRNDIGAAEVTAEFYRGKGKTVEFCPKDDKGEVKYIRRKYFRGNRFDSTNRNANNEGTPEVSKRDQEFRPTCSQSKQKTNGDDEEVYGLDNFWEMLEASPEREGQDGNDEKALESIPQDWFVNEMLNNPDFTRSVVRKFIDLNQDGQLTSDELLRNVV